MKKTCWLLALIAALILMGCDEFTTATQSEESSTVNLYKGGKIVSKKIIQKANDNQTVAMLVGSDTLCNIYVSCQDICGPDPEKIYFEVYAQKKGFYSIRKATSNNEVSFDLDKDFTPVEPNKTCGTISDKRYGSSHFSSIQFYQNQQLVAIVPTDTEGRFTSDLPLGSYTVKLFNKDGSQLKSDSLLVISKQYDDYFIRLYNIIGQ